jgi:DUF4097 and DUF4098 domain-containing protein YvlB
MKEQEILHKRFTFVKSTKPKTVKIYNINGSIDITGYEGAEIQLKVEKTIRAYSKERLKIAREEADLGISKKGNTIIFYIESPFTNKDGSYEWDSRRIGYDIYMDFELKVPHKTHLFLKTLNAGNIEARDIKGDCTVEHLNGDIKVQNIEGYSTLGNVNGNIDAQAMVGDFNLKTSNGKIRMKEISGSGKVQNDNGAINVIFKEDPGSDSLFHSLNGEVGITFTEKLSADLLLTNLNGFISCQFPATFRSGRRNRAFKNNQNLELRVGKGGPKIKVHTLNGNIMINKRKN